MTPGGRDRVAAAWHWALVAALLVPSVGCGGTSPPPGAQGADGTDSPVSRIVSSYAILEADGWVLQEAVDPAVADPAVPAEPVPLTWWSEYVRSRAGSSEMVRLSGHDEDFARAGAVMSGLGFELNEAEEPGWRVLRGRGRDPVGPSLVVMANGSSSLMLLSYELEPDELSALAASVSLVDQAAWVSAGGVVR